LKGRRRCGFKAGGRGWTGRAGAHEAFVEEVRDVDWGHGFHRRTGPFDGACDGIRRGYRFRASRTGRASLERSGARQARPVLVGRFDFSAGGGVDDFEIVHAGGAIVEAFHDEARGFHDLEDADFIA